MKKVHVEAFIDNNLMVGDAAAIDGAIKLCRKEGLALEVIDGLYDYFSWKIRFLEDKKHTWLELPYLHKDWEKKIEKHIMGNKSLKTEKSGSWKISCMHG